MNLLFTTPLKLLLRKPEFLNHQFKAKFTVLKPKTYPIMSEKKGIELFTAATPNGHKISIFLEEAGLPYTMRVLDFNKKEQKEEWFLKINPNGRIPAIIDHDEGDFPVFESGAILIYLAEKTGKFLPKDPKKRSEVIQWLMFQMGGIGPMQGQANVFYRYAPEKIQFAIDRYQSETRRLYEVLERGLQGKEYLAGEYSIADMATFPWVRLHEWAGVSLEGLPNVQAWIKRIEERPAVQKGLNSPPSNFSPDQIKTAQSMLAGMEKKQP